MWQLHPIPRQILINGFYTAFVRSIAPDFVFRGETHDFWELVLLTSGSIGLTAGNDSFILKAPSAFLHAPMEFHSLRGEGGSSAQILIFSFSADLMPRCEHRVFALTEENIRRARQAFDLLHGATEHGEIDAGNVRLGHENEAQRALLLVEELLLTLSRAESLNASADGSAGQSNYRRALAVIEEQLRLPLNTEQLARRANMSPSLLKKTFSRYAGMGVMEYVRIRRVQAALPLLRAGRSVQEVALSLGFSDAGYFSTVFRRVTGHTPTYYRGGER